ncbi:MAG: DUF5615 family PIN-like protein [Methanobacteriota archaeon]
MSRFLADENVAASVVRSLIAVGHDVKDVKTEKLQGTADATLVDLARRERRIILTHDRGFADVLTRPLDPPVGVVLIRCADQRPDNVRRVLARLLSSPVANRMEGNLVVVSERQVVLHVRE